MIWLPLCYLFKLIIDLGIASVKIREVSGIRASLQADTMLRIMTVVVGCGEL